MLLAGGIALLSLYFSRAGVARAAPQAVISSAEGALIKQVQQDAASQLKEKDLAIAEVQQKVADLDKQRQDLAASLDARVAAREKEQAASRSAQIDQEKARLKAQGLSDTAVNAKLADFQSRIEATDAASLADLRRQLEGERAAAESNIQRLQAGFESSIASLGAERQKIEDAAKAREDDLRASMEARTKSLEAESAASKSALDSAKAALASMNARSQAASAADARILGFYLGIRDALSQRRFDAAVSGADSLRAYLAEPSVAALPEIQARLPVDLFLADTLSLYARREVDDASQNTGKLLAEAESLDAARQSAQAADAARRAGKIAEADSLYQDALSKVPELLAAHDWFMAEAATQEAARRGSLDAALGRADGAWKTGDRPAAVAAYRDALAYLPIDATARALVLERVGAEAVDRAERARLDKAKAAAADDTQAAASLDAAAVAALTARDWEGAISSWLQLLAAYPDANQVPSAIDGMKSALVGLKTDTAAAAEATKAEIDGLRAQAAAESSASATRIAELLKELDALGTSSAAAAKAESMAGAAVTLSDMRDAYTQLTQRFAAAGGDATGDLLQLEQFFGDPRMDSTFAKLPQILDLTLAAYSKAAVADRSDNAAQIARTAYGMPDIKLRARYLDDQETAYAADPFMSAFISALASSGQQAP